MLFRSFQNIRLFPRMTVLENLIVAQHNKLMRASAFTIGGLLGLPGYRAAEKEAVAKARGGKGQQRRHVMACQDQPAGKGRRQKAQGSQQVRQVPHLLPTLARGQHPLPAAIFDFDNGMADSCHLCFTLLAGCVFVVLGGVVARPHQGRQHVFMIHTQ